MAKCSTPASSSGPAEPSLPPSVLQLLLSPPPEMFHSLVPASHHPSLWYFFFFKSAKQNKAVYLRTQGSLRSGAQQTDTDVASQRLGSVIHALSLRTQNSCLVSLLATTRWRLSPPHHPSGCVKERE